MLIQIAIGTALLIASVLIAGLSFWVFEWRLIRLGGWIARPPHRPKLMLVLCLAALWVLAQMTIAVWLWALTFLGLSIFSQLEEAVYFALVAFTTLGFGDILLPAQWRLLGGMAALNGLLNIGLMTAAMVESVRQVRLVQIAATEQG